MGQRWKERSLIQAAGFTAEAMGQLTQITATLKPKKTRNRTKTINSKENGGGSVCAFAVGQAVRAAVFVAKTEQGGRDFKAGSETATTGLRVCGVREESPQRACCTC